MPVVRETGSTLSGAPNIAIRGRVEIFTLGSKLPHQLAQFFQPPLGRADGQTFLALGIRARLARVEPVLNGAREQPIGDIPDIGFLIGIRDAVAEIDGLAERFAEGVFQFLHG